MTHTRRLFPVGFLPVLFVALFIAAHARCQTVDVQATPLSMKSFQTVAGLKITEAGVWNCLIHNNGTYPVSITTDDLQFAFPDIHFLTPDQARVLLTRKQGDSIWQIGSDLGGYALMGLALRVSPWALAAQPILQKLTDRAKSRIPDETVLLASLMGTVVVPAGSTAHVVMISSLMPKVRTYVATLSIRATPQVVSVAPTK